MSDLSTQASPRTLRRLTTPRSKSSARSLMGRASCVEGSRASSWARAACAGAARGRFDVAGVGSRCRSPADGSSMLARIRAASTSRPAAQASARARTAPCAGMKSEGQTASSACQSPRPRWCACGIAASSVAAWCGARVAAAMATIAATGLRLCGIAEEVPRPAWRASATSPTSPCASSARSRPILPSAPQSTATPQPSATQASRCACQAPAGTAQAEPRADPPRDRRPLVAERGQRADRAAELQLQRRRARRAQPRPAAQQRRQPADDLVAEAHHLGRLHQRAPEHRRLEMAAGERAAALRPAGRDRPRSGPALPASPAPSRCRSRPGWCCRDGRRPRPRARRAATRSRSCCTSGIASAPARRASFDDPLDVERRAAAGGDDRRRRAFRDQAFGGLGLGQRRLEREHGDDRSARRRRSTSMSALASVRSKSVPVMRATPLRRRPAPPCG